MRDGQADEAGGEVVTAQSGQQAGKEGDEVAYSLQADGQPPVGDDGGEPGPLVLVDSELGLPDELVFHPVSSDGRHPAYRLPKVGVDRGPGHRFKSLQLAGGRDVDPGAMGIK